MHHKRAYSRQSIRSALGFTLIELVIAIAIVGILSAIAFPFYQEHITKTRRAEAMAALTSAASAFERYRAAGGRFSYADACVSTDDDCDTPLANGVIPEDGAGPFYRIRSAVSADGRSFVLTAQATDEWESRDGALQIDNSGVKRWQDKRGDVFNCWPQGSSAPCDEGSLLADP